MNPHAGGRRGPSSLTQQQVEDVFARVLTESPKVLGRVWGVSEGTIRGIVLRRSRADVPIEGAIIEAAQLALRSRSTEGKRDSARRAALAESYGDWTVICEVDPLVEESGTPQRQILVRCVCGAEGVKYLSALRGGKTSKCKACAARKAGAKRATTNPAGPRELVPGWLIRRAAEGAIERGIPWSLSRDDLDTLWMRQGHRCALSGVILVMWSMPDKRNTASLDRIDSGGAYAIDNVQWVHKTLNIMKQSYSDAEFVAWCMRVAAHQHSKDPNVTPAQRAARAKLGVGVCF